MLNCVGLITGCLSSFSARLEAVESFKFTIDRYHVCGPLALRDFIQKCKTLFVNLKSMEVFREFIGFQATDTPKVNCIFIYLLSKSHFLEHACSQIKTKALSRIKETSYER